jgi:hypothetical protein
MTPTSTASGQQLFLTPEAGIWKALGPNVIGETDAAKRQMLPEAAIAREELKTVLLPSLQMQHVVALAGSGTPLERSTTHLQSRPSRRAWKYHGEGRLIGV